MEARGLFCEDCCDVPATQLWDEGLTYAWLTGRHRYTPVCHRCLAKRDTTAPAEPDNNERVEAAS